MKTRLARTMSVGASELMNSKRYGRAKECLRGISQLSFEAAVMEYLPLVQKTQNAK